MISNIAYVEVAKDEAVYSQISGFISVFERSDVGENQTTDDPVVEGIASNRITKQEKALLRLSKMESLMPC